VTRYDLFRKRIAPIAFAVAIALLVRETCNKQERTHATVVLDFGAAEPNVVSVDADLSVDHAVVNTFHQARLAGQSIGKPKFEAVTAERDGTLHLEVELTSGHRALDRNVHVEEGATVTLSLGLDLAP
jgi:hypothetical protein